MTLDEFRNQTREKILNCETPEEAKRVVTQAIEFINKSDVSESAKRQFLTTLYTEIDRHKQVLLEKYAARSLSAIVAAAQQVIAANLPKK